MKRAIQRAGLVLFTFLTVVAFAGREFIMPTAQPAHNYPARDEHSDEGVTVAIDPYDTLEKMRVFTVDWLESGYLPVFVVITNDSAMPVSLNSVQVQLVTARRTKLAPATEDDLYRRIARPRSSGPSPYPIPLPRKKGAVKREALDEIQRAQFAAKAIEPHSTQAGFLFFDVDGITAPLAGANFYLSGLHNSKGTDLLYFEISLEKYLSAPQPPAISAAPKN
jgi:hypothetical protein